MSQPIVQPFVTTFDGTGTDQMSKALKGINQDMTNTQTVAEATGRSLDSMGGRSERIAASFVFRNLALDATGAANSIKGAASAQEGMFVGLELLGRAGLAFAGEIGLAVLGVAAFVQIIMNLKKGSEETAESIKKQTTELINHSIASSEAADTLKKLGVISNDTYKALESDSAQYHKQALDKIKSIADEVGKQASEAKAKLADLTAEEARMTTGMEKLDTATQQYIKTAVNQQEGQRAEKIKSLRAEIEKLTATEDAAKKILDEKDKTKDLDAQIKLNQILIDQAITKQKNAGQFTDLINAERTAQEEINDAQTAYVAALRTGDKAAEESAQKRMASAQQEANAIKAALNSQASYYGKLDGLIHGYGSDIASVWENSNGQLVISSAKAGAAVIDIIAQTIEFILAAEAAKDIAQYNYAGAAQATALGAAVGVAAAAAKTAIGGGGSSSSASISAPSGSSSASSASSSSGGGTNTNLYVEIKGGYFDEAAGINLAKHLSKLVQQNNVRLVSSTVLASVGQVPG